MTDRHVHDVGQTDETDGIWECLSDLLSSPNGEGQISVVGLPSANNLRSIVVLEDRHAAARLVRRQFGGGNPCRTVRAGAVAVLIVLGLAGTIPAWRPSIPAAHRLGYRAWLCNALPTGARVGAVLLGPPRANRKPVVLVTDRLGRLLGVAKFGVNGVTRGLVRREAMALLEVGPALLGTVHVPRLLTSGAVAKGEVLLMAPLPAPVLGCRPTRTALIDVVRAVAAIDQRPSEHLRDVASHPRLAPVRPEIEEIARCTEGTKIGSFHGDFHPGNLAVAEDGRVILWDWERLGHGAPVGIDLLHHDLHSWITQDGVAPREAVGELVTRAPTLLKPFGIGVAQAPAVARDYLVRLAARYAADEQDRAGSRLGAIEQWLFPALLGK